jgi:hypothetical protein
MKNCELSTQFLTKLEGFATASTTHATEKGKLDSWLHRTEGRIIEDQDYPQTDQRAPLGEDHEHAKLFAARMARSTMS